MNIYIHTYISSRHDPRVVGRKKRAPLLPLAYLLRFFLTKEGTWRDDMYV